MLGANYLSLRAFARTHGNQTLSIQRQLITSDSPRNDRYRDLNKNLGEFDEKISTRKAVDNEYVVRNYQKARDLKIPLYSQLKPKLESKGLDSITSGQIAWFVSSFFYGSVCGFVIFCIMRYYNLRMEVSISLFCMLLVGYVLSLFNRYTFSLIFYGFLAGGGVLLLFLLFGISSFYVLIVFLFILIVAIANLVFIKQKRISIAIFTLSMFIQYSIIYLFVNIMVWTFGK
ncbi:MAG: hypothetical protein K2N12_09345 [Helicobacter sp.]|nr:hypothetical protein [Helicobacter sp.]